MAWKWWQKLTGRPAETQARDTAGGGTSPEARIAESLEELERCLAHLKDGKGYLDQHVNAEAGYKQALTEALTAGLGTTSEQLPALISSLLHEAAARERVASLQKELAAAQSKLEQIAGRNQLGDHREQVMELADKLHSSRSQADIFWLIMQIRSSTARMEVSFATRGLTDAQRKDPRIAAKVAEIEALLSPDDSLGAALIRPHRA